MILKSLIIHQIKKEAGATYNTEVYTTTSVLDKNNTSVKKIINSLEESFSKKTLKRAKFSEDGFKNKISNFNLKRFYTISATVNGITLSAPRSSFNEDMISFIEGKVIINSAELVQRLQEEKNSSLDE